MTPYHRLPSTGGVDTARLRLSPLLFLLFLVLLFSPSAEASIYSSPIPPAIPFFFPVAWCGRTKFVMKIIHPLIHTVSHTHRKRERGWNGTTKEREATDKQTHMLKPERGRMRKLRSGCIHTQSRR